MNDLKTDTRDLRELLCALRVAGWKHSVSIELLNGRDADGAPWDDGQEVHRWRRGSRQIELVREYGGPPLHFINLSEPHGDDEFDMVSVGVGWVKREGVSGLFRVAAAAGVFDAMTVAEIEAADLRENAEATA